MNKTFIGIDPGKTGAITIITGSKVTMHKMPTNLSDKLYLLHGVYIRPVFIMEGVHSSPQQGRVSAFTFGRGYGQLEAILDYLKDIFTVDIVTPQRWQTAVDCLTGGDKKISVARVKTLFPDLEGVNQKNADSVLLAYYGYMKYGR